MEIKKSVDMLTQDSVSIATRRTVTVEGETYFAGEIHRRAYSNSPSGRQKIAENEPEEVVSAVLAMWGETPTRPDYPPNTGNEAEEEPEEPEETEEPDGTEEGESE